MPLEQTEAIILNTFPLADQDKLVTFFSRDRGVIRGVAKGARKFGNRFGSSLEPLSVVRVFYYEKELRDLVTISNCDLLDSFFDLQRSPEMAFTLAYFVELVEEFFPARAGEPRVFRLLCSALEALRSGADRDFTARYFEVWLLKINGLLPDFRRCKKCRRPVETGWLAPKRDGVYCPACASNPNEEMRGVVAEFVDWAAKNSLPAGGSPPFSEADLEMIRQVLESILIYHLERKPKSLAFFKKRTP
jgi:DNA repair protein RecO (recombination protein O)